MSDYYIRNRTKLLNEMNEYYKRYNYKVGCARCGSVVIRETFFRKHAKTQKCVKYGIDNKNWYIYNGRINQNFKSN